MKGVKRQIKNELSAKNVKLISQYDMEMVRPINLQRRIMASRYIIYVKIIFNNDLNFFTNEW